MENTITLQCLNCQKDFIRPLKYHRSNLKRGRISTYCSPECHNSKRPIIKTQCKNFKCKKEFITKSNKQSFCSITCSVSINNQMRLTKTLPLEPSFTICQKCKCQVKRKEKSRIRKLCDTCWFKDWSKTTISDLGVTDFRDRHSRIRSHSRYVYKTNNGKMSCHECGFDAHINICHIKPVNLFPLDTPISIVNSYDNLIALCPNHHWLFDHGQLDIGNELGNRIQSQIL